MAAPRRRNRWQRTAAAPASGPGEAARDQSACQIGGVEHAGQLYRGPPGKSDVVVEVAGEPEAESELQCDDREHDYERRLGPRAYDGMGAVHREID